MAVHQAKHTTSERAISTDSRDVAEDEPGA
jgi:hypothetical protein